MAHCLSSDPICSSAGCDSYLPKPKADQWPKNYPVPNLGMDFDIKSTLKSLSVAEK